MNTRPWPENYVIQNPHEPPPIAREIDIHVIDVVRHHVTSSRHVVSGVVTPPADNQNVVPGEMSPTLQIIVFGYQFNMALMISKYILVMFYE